MKQLKIKTATFILLLGVFLIPTKNIAQERDKPIHLGDDPEIIEQIKIAITYMRGNDTLEVDYAEAYKILLNGAKKHNDYCMFMCGQYLSQGIGVERNYKEAVKWLHKSAQNENAYAQVVLGMLHKNGRLGNVDFKKAAKWFYKAVQNDHSDGYCYLAYMHLKGFGVEQDYCKAYEYFNLSAAKGNVEGTSGLAYCYENGYGTEIDLGKAIELYELASEAGNQQATDRLATVNAGGEKSSQIMPLGFETFSNTAFNPVASTTEKTALSKFEEGYIVIYDWSGMQVEEHYPILIKETTNGKLNVITDNRNIETGFNIENNVIQFDSLFFLRDKNVNERFDWKITHAYLKTEIINGQQVLVADAKLYSHDGLEPGPSAYIVLTGKAITENQFNLKRNAFDCGLKAYPNPFMQWLTIEFVLNQPAIASVYITDLAGKKIEKISTNTNFSAGVQTLKTNTIFPNGVYMVVLELNKQKQTIKIIKE